MDAIAESRTPIYLQLREIIRTKIEEGEYSPGMAIPSENELAEQYDINRLTVRSAVDALVHEGLLRRVQGKGVYVLGPKIERDLDRLNGFTQTILEKNVQPSTRVLTKVLRKAGRKYGLVFGIDPEDDIYYIKRLCYAGGEALSLEEIFIPRYIVPKLEGIDLTIFSLYEVYDFYGVRLARGRQTLDLAQLEQKDACMLGTDAEQAVLLFECASYDENDRLIEFSRNYTRGDKCSFSVCFHNQPEQHAPDGSFLF